MLKRLPKIGMPFGPGGRFGRRNNENTWRNMKNIAEQRRILKNSMEELVILFMKLCWFLYNFMIS